MQNSLFEAICRIGIFMICIRAILHFRPNEAYEKYLRLLAGIMILIQLFLPVGRIFLGNGGKETAEVLERFKRELEQGMEEAMGNAEAADALLEQMTLDEVERRLEEQRKNAGEEGALPKGETYSGAEETREDGTYQNTESNLENGTGEEGGSVNERDVGLEGETVRESGAGGTVRGAKRIEEDREYDNPGREEENRAAEDRITIRVEPIEPVSVNSP